MALDEGFQFGGKAGLAVFAIPYQSRFGKNLLLDLRRERRPHAQDRAAETADIGLVFGGIFELALGGDAGRQSSRCLDEIGHGGRSFVKLKERQRAWRAVRMLSPPDETISAASCGPRNAHRARLSGRPEAGHGPSGAPPSRVPWPRPLHGQRLRRRCGRLRVPRPRAWRALLSRSCALPRAWRVRRQSSRARHRAAASWRRLPPSWRALCRAVPGAPWRRPSGGRRICRDWNHACETYLVFLLDWMIRKFAAHPARGRPRIV